MDASAQLNISENNLFVYRSRILTENDFSDGVLEKSTVLNLNNTNNTDLIDTRGSHEWLTSSEENDTHIPFMIETFTESFDMGNSSNLKENIKSESDVTEIIITNIYHNRAKEKLNITIGSALKMGHFYIVKINFGALMTHELGLPYTTYNTGEELRYFTATLGQKSIFPCIQDDHKATFDLRVFRHHSMRSISGAELINTEIV